MTTAPSKSCRWRQNLEHAYAHSERASLIHLEVSNTTTTPPSPKSYSCRLGLVFVGPFKEKQCTLGENRRSRWKKIDTQWMTDASPGVITLRTLDARSRSTCHPYSLGVDASSNTTPPSPNYRLITNALMTLLTILSSFLCLLSTSLPEALCSCWGSHVELAWLTVLGEVRHFHYLH